MKKLLLILIIVIFSTSSSNAAPAYECNLKENKCLQTRVVDGIEIKYEYIGQIKEGKPDGKGKLNILTSKFGKSFAEGTFKIVENNFIKLIDGKLYDDDFVSYKKNGEIYKLIYLKDKDGQKKDTILEGTFKQFILIKGSVAHSNGHKFIGEFYDNGLMKEGTYLYLDGQKFTGTFDKDRGLPQKGLMLFPNGEKYSGTFGVESNGKIYYIDGISSLKNGDRYEGSFFPQSEPKYKNGTYYHLKEGGRSVYTEGVKQYFPPERKFNNNQPSKKPVVADWEYIVVLIAAIALPLFIIYKLYQKVKDKKNLHKFSKYFIFITVVVAVIGFLTGSISKAVESWFSLFMIGAAIYWIETKDPVILGFSIREISRLLYAAIILVVGWQIFCRIFQLC